MASPTQINFTIHRLASEAAATVRTQIRVPLTASSVPSNHVPWFFSFSYVKERLLKTFIITTVFSSEFVPSTPNLHTYQLQSRLSFILKTNTKNAPGNRQMMCIGTIQQGTLTGLTTLVLADCSALRGRRRNLIIYVIHQLMCISFP